MDIKKVEKIIKDSDSVKNEFSYEIVEHLLDLREDSNGWKTELNLISYNGKNPVYDIRTWSPKDSNGNRNMTKGNTFSPYVFNKLAKFIIDNKEKFKEN